MIGGFFFFVILGYLIYHKRINPVLEKWFKRGDERKTAKVTGQPETVIDEESRSYRRNAELIPLANNKFSIVDESVKPNFNS